MAEHPEADTGSGWFGKTEKLTPAEERARDAERRWAIYAKTHDVPGPTRVKFYITRRKIINPPDSEKLKDNSSE